MKLMLSALATFVLALAAACGGDGGGGQTAPTATRAASSATTLPASPTAGAGGCPVAADVCTFARTVAQAVAANNFDSILATAQGEQFTCPATRPQGSGGPYPLCDNAPGGSTRTGYRFALLASEGQVVDLAGLRAELTRFVAGATPAMSDTYGNGATRLFSVGCPAGVVPCGNQFALAFSQLRGVPTRSEMILFFERQGGAFVLKTPVIFGPLLQPGGSRPSCAAAPSRTSSSPRTGRR